MGELYIQQEGIGREEGRNMVGEERKEKGRESKQTYRKGRHCFLKIRFSYIDMHIVVCVSTCGVIHDPKKLESSVSGELYQGECCATLRRIDWGSHYNECKF